MRPPLSHTEREINRQTDRQKKEELEKREKEKKEYDKYRVCLSVCTCIFIYLHNVHLKYFKFLKTKSFTIILAQKNEW
jgi:hypothetical protein